MKLYLGDSKLRLENKKEIKYENNKNCLIWNLIHQTLETHKL